MTNACGLSAAIGTAFCGPTALAAVTGATPEAAVAAILKVRETLPKPAPRGTAELVKTTWSNEIAPALALLGHTAEHWVCDGRTFAQWLRAHRTSPHKYVVLITGHFVAFNAGWFVDTRFRVPVELKRLIKTPYARKRVGHVWRVEPVTQPEQQEEQSTMAKTFTHRLGKSRAGNGTRVWLEGLRLVHHGFTHATQVERKWTEGKLVLRVVDAAAFANLERANRTTVAGSIARPIIDITGEAVAKAFPSGNVTVTWSAGRCVIEEA